METLDRKIQQKLIRDIFLNLLGIVLVAVALFWYVLPTYTVLWEKIASTNATNADLREMEKNWPKVDEFFNIVSRHSKVTFTPEDRKNSRDIVNILKKTNPELSYEDWMNSELEKMSEMTAERERNDKIISGIIPTYSELNFEDSLSELNIENTQFDKNRIVLTDIVSFVENDILKKYNLKSYSSIGFNGLSFEKQSLAAINIGSYKIPLELTGTNKDLADLIDRIQDSGQLAVEDGKLKAPKNPEARDFSNLLVTIDQIAFSESLEDPEKENKLSIGLVFYVRAKSYSDLLKINQWLSAFTKALLKSTSEFVSLCGSLEEPVCKNENSLKAIESIRAIVDPIKQLDTQLDASIKSSASQDVSAEFNKLVNVTTTLNALNGTFEKNKAIVNASKTQNNSR